MPLHVKYNFVVFSLQPPRHRATAGVLTGALPRGGGVSPLWRGSAEMLRGYVAAATADRRFTTFLVAHSLDKVLHAPFNPFFPIFVAEVLGRPQAFAAAFRGAETLAQTCASFGFGLLSTNGRAKASLVLAMLNTPLAALIFLTRSPSLLMVAAAVHGALSGVASSVSSLYMISLAPKDQLGAAASLQYVGNTLGSAVGSAIGGSVIAWGAARSRGVGGGFGALAIFMLLGAVPVQLAVLVGLPSLSDDREGGSSARELARAKSGSSISHPLALLQRPSVRSLLLMQGLRTVWIFEI